MRVQVDSALWHMPGAFADLQRLMRRAALGQHQVETDEDHILATPFCQQAIAPSDRVEWDELLTRTLGSARHAPAGPGVAGKQAHARVSGRFRRDLDEGFDVPHGDLGRWAEEPLTIFLENRTDGLLVDWAARIAASDGRPRLGEAIADGWVRMDGRGGAGELLKAVARPSVMRCVAVIDSDRDRWGDAVAKGPSIRESSRQGQVPVHTLRGRELENYVPRRHWRAVVGPKARKGRVALVARENQLWARLGNLLDREAEHLKRSHGGKAFDRVRRAVEAKATRSAPPPSLRGLLDALDRMSPEERGVDDIKARLGKKFAELGVQRARDEIGEFQVAHIDPLLVEDLRNLGRMIEEWL